MKNIKLFEEFDDMNVELPDNNDEVTENAELIGSFLKIDKEKFLSATEGIINKWSIASSWDIYMKPGKVLNLFKQGDKYILAISTLEGTGFDNNDSPVKFENGCWVKGSWN